MNSRNASLNELESLLRQLPSLYLSRKYYKILEIVEHIKNYSDSSLDGELREIKSKAHEWSDYILISDISSS